VSSKYDQYIHNPPHLRLTLKSDKSVFFDGLMVKEEQLGYDFTFGHQFVRKPFKGDNPCHTHNFWEFMAWYGSNPDDPDDFGAEVVFYFGKELEKHIFTRPTIVSLPPGLPHHPFEITRLTRPIIQIEIMIGNKGITPEPCFEKDKDWNPATKVIRELL
jgi:hypothetical protein